MTHFESEPPPPFEKPKIKVEPSPLLKAKLNGRTSKKKPWVCHCVMIPNAELVTDGRAKFGLKCLYKTL
jgi:hypothetical protein